MNPGPSEEVGKVATSVVEGLRSTPLVLALIVFNIIFMIAVYLSNRDERGYTERVMAKMLDTCATGR